MFFAADHRNSVAGHLVSDEKEKHVCPSCGKIYKHKFILNRHQRYECGDRRPFSCSFCPFTCKQKCNLKIHVFRKHKISSDHSAVFVSVNLFVFLHHLHAAPSLIAHSPKDFCCTIPFCLQEANKTLQFIFGGMINKGGHVYATAAQRKLTTYKCCSGEDARSTTAHTAHLPHAGKSKMETDSDYQCGTCGKTYVHKGSLVKHRKFECGDLRPFRCSLCPYSSKQKGHLKLHMFTKHTNVSVVLDEGGKFLCTNCNKSYRHKYNLNKHLRYQCGDLRPFHCHLCPFTTKYMFSLKKHLIQYRVRYIRLGTVVLGLNFNTDLSNRATAPNRCSTESVACLPTAGNTLLYSLASPPTTLTVQVTAPSTLTVQVTAPSTLTVQVTAPSTLTVQVTAPSTLTVQVTAPNTLTVQVTAPSTLTEKNRTEYTDCTNNRSEYTDCTSNRTEYTDCTSNRTEYTVCTSNRTEYTDCTSNRTEYTDCTSNRTNEYTDCTSNRTEYTDCTSNRTEYTVCTSNRTEYTDCTSNRSGEYTDCTSNRTEYTDCTSNRTEYTDCTSNRTEYTDCTNNRSEYTDCTSNRTEYTDCTSNRTEYTDCTSNRTEYTNCTSNRSEYTDCTSNRSEYTDCTSNRTEYTDYTSNRTDYTDCTSNRTDYTDCTSNRSEYTDCTSNRSEYTDWEVKMYRWCMECFARHSAPEIQAEKHEESTDYVTLGNGSGVDGDTFRCPDCGKSYRHKSNLTKHRRYECGDLKPFTCTLCPYRAKQKCSLKLHVITKHKENTAGNKI
ncbi:hypothetical protein J6590_014838 [Homalodisca vitripennis]|nr:hypothetical protein J6590_014838 [Homalodisca vitripennis]